MASKERQKQLDDIEKQMDEESKPQPTSVPEGAVLNPNYKEGSGLPKYMPSQAANDVKSLEEPYVDPISLAATAATGGLSSVGPAVMNAAKNKATTAVAGSLLDRIKAAAAARQQRMSNSIPEAAQQVGQNTMYQPTSTPIDYQRQILEQLRQRGKLGSNS